MDWLCEAKLRSSGEKKKTPLFCTTGQHSDSLHRVCSLQSNLT